jgi:hypothetical protein
LPTHVCKAVRASMQCRTTALGGHIPACPDGHLSRLWYHSCRHQACPVRTGRTSRPSAGWRSSGRGCRPVTMIMSSARSRMPSVPSGWPTFP